MLGLGANITGGSVVEDWKLYFDPDETTPYLYSAAFDLSIEPEFEGRQNVLKISDDAADTNTESPYVYKSGGLNILNSSSVKLEFYLYVPSSNTTSVNRVNFGGSFYFGNQIPQIVLDEWNKVVIEQQTPNVVSNYFSIYLNNISIDDPDDVWYISSLKTYYK